MSRILVTGASGFVGSAVCRSAAERGHAVTGIDRRERPFSGTGAFECADIRDRAAVASLAAGVDAIIHCAAIVGPAPASADPVSATEVNVLGTLSILEAARKQGCRLVNLSTATLYGRLEDARPLDETAPVDPVGIYDATKLMSETLCHSYRKSFGVKAASFRTGFVYGLNHSTGDYFVGRLLSGTTRIEEAGRDHPCDFTYVKDLAAGLVLAAEAESLPEPVYNLTSGTKRTRGELARIVARHFPTAQIVLAPGVDPARHLRGPCVIERARRDFGYAPAFDLEAGISDWLAEADRNGEE